MNPVLNALHEAPGGPHVSSIQPGRAPTGGIADRSRDPVRFLASRYG